MKNQTIIKLHLSLQLISPGSYMYKYNIRNIEVLKVGGCCSEMICVKCKYKYNLRKHLTSAAQIPPTEKLYLNN